MKRILITGNAGSGKSYVSKRLHSIMGIQRYCLDSIVWKSGWQMTSIEEKKEKIERLIEKEEWIIDGVSFAAQDTADCVIFLDCSRLISYLRIFRRNLPYMFKSRPDLPKGCPELKIVPKLMAIIWNFPNKVKPGILKRLNEAENQERHHLKTKNDVTKFLKKRFTI